MLSTSRRRRSRSRRMRRRRKTMMMMMKTYPKQALGCSVVGASAGAVDPKTMKKWVWEFIESIGELVDEVVRNNYHHFLPSPYSHLLTLSNRLTLIAG